MTGREKKLLLPYWKSEIVYEEPVLLVRSRDGGFAPKKMMYPVREVLAVRRADGGRARFSAPGDYFVRGGELCFPQDTALPHLDYGEMYLDEPNGLRVASIKERGKFLRTENGVFFNGYAVLFTYRTEKKFLMPPPEKQSAAVAVRERLRNRENLNFFFYGDSITTGVNASGYFNIRPHTPVFSQLAVRALRERFGYIGQTDIAHVNTAEGGWTSIQGLERLQERVLDKKPDVLFLGFGMNDGGGKPNPSFGAAFGERMEEMVGKVHAAFPDCLIVLASPMMPNADALNYDENYPVLSNQPQCAAALEKIALSHENTAFIDVSRYSARIAERKEFHDMGDTMVHPNDFIARLYAQMFLNLFIDDKEAI